MAVGDFVTYAYTGALQTAQLLANKRYKIECWGAQGGGANGGKGGYCYGEIVPVSDTDINIYVGQNPTSGAGGYNGGGNGGNAGGGGASDVRIGGTALADRKIVAAGGGGAGQVGIGGVGGGLVGGVGGLYPGYTPGQPGTQLAGGSLNGILGVGGSVDSLAGGGGGGYYGGGGGGSRCGGGGGSSNHDGLINGYTISNVQTGNGSIKITEIEYSVSTLLSPTTYSYTGDIQSLLLKKGKYKLDCYGGQGGISLAGKIGGKGGHAAGEIQLENDSFLFLFVGGQGGQPAAGWNGGGYGTDGAAGGGGASDIRVGNLEFSNRVIVGGGGGGQADQSPTDGTEGAGGGLIGNDGDLYGTNANGKGGTQSAGGAGSNSNNGGNFGLGGNGESQNGGGGGAGYYGGGGAYGYNGGGGGSSFYGTLENGETTLGINEGDGYIVITPLIIPYNGFPQII